MKSKYRALMRYLEPAVIQAEDRDALYEFSKQGLAVTAYIGEFNREIGMTTDAGHLLARKEELRRSPLKRFVYFLADCLPNGPD